MYIEKYINCSKKAIKRKNATQKNRPLCNYNLRGIVRRVMLSKLDLIYQTK
jgi:hypothetical protein